MPKRVSLYFDPDVNDLLELGVEYPVSKEVDIRALTHLGYGAVPLDDFGYEILHTKNAPWSKEIQFVFNVTPDAGTPTCSAGSKSLRSRTIEEITDLFVFDSMSDRIRIDSITGVNNNITVQGQPLLYGEMYMIYDFVDVKIQTGTAQVGADANLSTINFTMGKDGEWGASCSVVLDLFMLAQISSEQELEVQTETVFERTILISDGVPNSNVLIEFAPSLDMLTFQASYTDPDDVIQIIPLSLTSSTQHLFEVDENGEVSIMISGHPSLTDETDPYLLITTVEILESSGDVNLVHAVNYITSLYITNDITLLDDFSSIKSILMDNAGMDPTINSYVYEAEAPSDVDIVAEINLAPNIGTAPFTYAIVNKSGPTTPGIVQQGTTPVFDITTMVGATTPGRTWVFTAQVTDANNVVSVFDFDFSVLDVPVVAVPVLTDPADGVYEYNETMSLQLVATNGPILSYAVSSGVLPTGITLNTTTGLISGSSTDVGTDTIGFTATNSFGVSVPISWDITINADPGIIAPIITSAAYNVIPAGDGNVDYLITYTGSASEISINGLPSGWVFTSATNRITGFMNKGDSHNFNIYATNSAGSDALHLTFIRHP